MKDDEERSGCNTKREKVEDVIKRIRNMKKTQRKKMKRKRKTEIGHTDTDTYKNRNRNNWRLLQEKQVCLRF